MYRSCYRHISNFLLAALLLGLLAAFPSVPIIHAAGNIQYVSSYLDNAGAITDCRDFATGCSLRDALNAAADGDTIQFAHSTPWPITYTLTNGTLTVNHNVTIQGPGAHNLTISGGGKVGVFLINNGITATIGGLTIANGHTADGGAINSNHGTLTVTDSILTSNYATDGGGGIVNWFGTLTVTNSLLINNLGGNGGGIFVNSGLTTVTNSTFSVNTASGSGGGINSNSSAYLTNVTLAGNGAASGGGIYMQSSGYSNGNAYLTNVTLAGNSAILGGGIYAARGGGAITQATLLASSSGGNCTGVPITSNDYNLATDTSCAGLSAAHDLTGVASGLDPAGLRNNGGSTATVALLLNSPAIEAGGPCASGVTQDQRGLPRVGNCDIGAYEYQPVTPTVLSLTPSSITGAGGAVTIKGTGFQTGTTVTAGGQPVMITSLDPAGTSLTVTFPVHAAASVPVVIANPGGLTATTSITYVLTIASVSPGSGSATGGSSVTITGTGFADGARVMFGNMPVTVTNVTATTVTVTAPTHTAGTVDVTMTFNGQSATSANAYTFGPVNALPGAQLQGGTRGGIIPSALPVTRPTASPVTGLPSPLPPPR